MISPPVSPMLARLARELPGGDYLYEPKWDGFRCLAFRSASAVELRSRNDRPLGRYFPEVVEAVASLPERDFVLDGELVVLGPAGFDFEALLSRLHPAPARVKRLRAESPAALIAFDLLALADRDLRELRFAVRRAELEGLLRSAEEPLVATPVTDDLDVARGWLERLRGGGADGVVAKHRDLAYRPGARTMIKVKAQTTADCVVAGVRLLADRPLLSSLLLGVYDAGGELAHIGVVTQFREEQRRRLLLELQEHVVALEEHPWRAGFLTEGSPVGRLRGAAARWSPQEMELDWVPIAPVRVCEVAYDHFDRGRLRHPARFRRWRPDRDPRSCTFEQFPEMGTEAAELLASR
jgi:ATP-dependent DNA ligase